jgi:hypothetical protein
MSRISFLDWFGARSSRRDNRTSRRKSSRPVNSQRSEFESGRSDRARSILERLEERTLLAVTALIDANSDAVIDGTAGSDSLTMSVENQGLANETLRISDGGGVTAGAGFTQDGPNSATILTSAITGLDIFINTLDSTDIINILATPAGIRTSVAAGGGNDEVSFADGVSLRGGTADGGADNDRIDYSRYTTPVAVNLGLGTTGLSATLENQQEVPPTPSAASGTATVTYDAVTKLYDISVTVTGLDPALVTGFHIHRAVFGVNGPIIQDLPSLGPLNSAGTGFTFSATGVSLASSALGGVANEAALLGGVTYVNVHTAQFPGGIIRGQLFSEGNVNLAPNGTATGTAGISDFENVLGGSGADSLVEMLVTTRWWAVRAATRFLAGTMTMCSCGATEMGRTRWMAREAPIRFR